MLVWRPSCVSYLFGGFICSSPSPERIASSSSRCRRERSDSGRLPTSACRTSRSTSLEVLSYPPNQTVEQTAV
jgi:hypothetical protein